MKLKWQYVFCAMVVVYVVSKALGFAYSIWPWIDIPFHIVGGFLAASLGLALWFEVKRSYKLKQPIPSFVVALGMVSFAALIAVLWECHEFVLDAWHYSKGEIGYLPMQPSLADTMKDLADGLIGGCLAVLAFNKRLE